MTSQPQSVQAAAEPKRLLSKMLLLLTDGVCGFAVAAIVVVVLAQIAGRLLGSPFSWTEELTRACFMWMVFTGMAASVRHADGARVTVLLQYLPAFIRRSALPIYFVSSLCFFGLVAWTGSNMVRQQVVMNEQIATLGIPGWIIGVVLPAAAVLSIFGLFQSLKTHRSVLAATNATLIDQGALK